VAVRHGERSVLFAGTSYYHTWYASRALRKLGWRADVLNWDADPGNQHHYHGTDFQFEYGRGHALRQARFYAAALKRYEIFHFSNAHCMSFGSTLSALASRVAFPGAEIDLLKRLGKKVVYSNNSCQDGVLQSSFAAWGPHSTCADCGWRTRPDVCSDERNRAWGEFRNRYADFQLMYDGNRADYNVDPSIHFVPQFYCLDPELWHPDILIPTNYRLPGGPDRVRIYHGVGHFTRRTEAASLRNIKSTHIYVPLVERLQAEGNDVELVFFQDVPNKAVRYYQAQSDIVVDMLTFGWFGATGREAMMLGKPYVCFIRPEWLETVRAEEPEYAAELPVVSATPETVEDVLRDLVANPETRREIGRRSREFALKWHSADAAAQRLDGIYSTLLRG
jgi:glycosyltransferase involved in cell wall biosynthesis